MDAKFVTRPTLHFEMSALKAYAEANAHPMLVTDTTFHLLTSPLNAAWL
jgi:hypothetical protein